jgi:hypothetical protein
MRKYARAHNINNVAFKINAKLSIINSDTYSQLHQALGDWRNKNTDQYINNVELKLSSAESTQIPIHSYTKHLETRERESYKGMTT